MTNSYMTDPVSSRKFLFARTTWAKSVSLTEAAATVKTGLSRLLFVAMLVALGATSAFATTCATATAISPASLPIVSQAIVCGATNEVDYTGLAASAYGGSCVTTQYYGGFEAMYFITPTSSGLYNISVAGQTYTSIFVFNGCPTTAGTTCMGGVFNANATKTLTVLLTAGTQYFIMFDTWPTPNSPCPGTFSMSYLAPNSKTAVSNGGLWSSPGTWVGGVAPDAGSTVTIPAGSTVTLDAAVAVSGLTVDGTLQHSVAAAGLTVYGNMTVSATGKYYPHTSALAAMTTALTVQNTFTNNGYCNFTNGSITFNGGPLSSENGTLAGNGTWQDGIIRGINFLSTGSHTISITANVVVGGLAHTAGSLSTNGKVTIDNTGVSQGNTWNRSVQAAYITNMGALLSTPPVIFGTAVTPYANGAAATLNTRYFAGNNVYLCTVAGTFNATPPTDTGSAVFTTSGPTLLYIGTLGTVGNPFQQTAVTQGTQYFYGNNLYTCTVAGIPSAAAPPVHVSGTAVSGAATFRYVGTPGIVSGNFDPTNQVVRSLSITQAGDGYIQGNGGSNPTLVFSIGAVGATGTLPAGAALVPGVLAGAAANSSIQKSAIASISGTLPINSDGGASALSADPQSSAGVNAVFCTNAGNNYTVAPLVGFSPPTALNLVTNTGSGYAAAPTITVTGGILVAGTALTSANFAITVNQGKVVSVYCTGTAQYSVLPTLTMSAPAAGTTCTLAWPANCLPACTASITPAGQLSYAMTNAGYGYTAAPTVSVGTTTGTAAGGTFSQVATGFTARIGAYALALNYFTPAPINPPAQSDVVQVIPANRKLLALQLNGNGAGLNLTSNLTCYGGTPLALVASGNAPGNKLDLGGNNLYFSNPVYTGLTSTYNIAGTKAWVTNGSITLTTRGGGTVGQTLTFPFAGSATAPLQVVTGTGTSQANGSDILTVKVTENVTAPSNSSGTGLAIGNRSFTVNTTTYGGGAGTAGTNPTVRLAYNSETDLLVQSTALQNATFAAEGTSTSGPWTIRSAAFNAANATAMPANGTLTTATIAPGPITLTDGNAYAFAAAAPTITSTSIDGTTVCANSTPFTITGTGLSGVSAVAIGGTPVTAFTVVSDTQISATVGNGTTGVVSVTKLGGSTSGAATITVNPSPAAPSLTQSSYTGAFGSTQSITASGGAGSFNWYNLAAGGTAIASGDTYAVPACATGSNFWVAENDGTCEGARAQVSVTVSPAIEASATPTFICANNTPVSLSTNVTGATYSWASTQGSFSSATSATPTLNNLTYTAEARATITKNGCVASTPNISVGVYSFPAGVSPAATPSTLCEGQPTTLATGLSAGNFSAVCATPAAGLSTPPAGVTATTLILNGVAQPLPSGVSWSNSLDDGKFGPVPIGFNFNFFGNTETQVNIGTNGVINFGSYASFSGTQYIFTGGFPNAANPANTIAVCARDLRFGTPAGLGSLRYWTEGVAPNRRFIVQYDNVPIWGGVQVSGTCPTCTLTSGGQSAEAVFYETLGQIDIRVISANNGTSSTAAEINKYIGLQNATKTIGATAPNCSAPFQQNYWNGINSTIASPLTWSFIPPKNYTYNWTNAATTSVANAGTDLLYGAGTGITAPGVAVTTTSTPQTPTATVTYQSYIADPVTGCSNVYNVPVTVNPTPAAPTTSFGSATPLVMCGTQVPNQGNAMVSCPTCTGSQSYNWYTAATGGSLFQGSISEDFNSGVNPGTFTLVDNAALQNARCELTQASTGQYGALQLGSTGVNTNAYEIDFDLRVDLSDGTGGADGLSYSFGDNVVSTDEASMNAENGTGNKLKVAFVTYTNGSSPAGIYLMYNCTTNEQTPTTSGVLAYSNSTSWKNTSSDVHVDISIDALGQVTLLLDGTAPTASNGTFTNAQLPIAYLAANKSTWQHVFKARTGAAFSRCSIDNMIVVSQPVQAFAGIVQPISTSGSYYVQTLDGGCGSNARTEVALQVDPPPAFAITPGATICPNAYIPVTVTTGLADYTQFTWEPTIGGYLFNDAAGTQPYTGDSRTTVYVYSPANNFTFPAITCSALDGNGPVGNQCANTASSTFTTSTAPAAPVITASSLAPCNNTTITLNAGAAVSYSTPGVSSPTFDEDLGLVRLGQLGSPILDNTTATNSLDGTIGTATGTVGGYSNFTAFGPFTLNAANPVQFQISSTTTGTFYGNSMAIFIDYNQDGDFADAGETAYNEGATTSGPHTASGTFNIPLTALNGPTRMRVVCNEGTISGPTQSVFYGEWEDYTINITGGVSYTYDWTGGISATTISVTSNPITAPVSFQATISTGSCFSAASNVISVEPAVAPTVAPTAVAFSAGYTTPSVSVATSDEDVTQVRLRADVDGDGVYSTANGDYQVFNSVTAVNSLESNIGTASGTQGGYSNFTAFGPYTVNANYQHILLLGMGNEGFDYTNALAAWIDYNQDGDFIDVDEQIIIGATVVGIHTRTVNFTPPVTAKNGTTRLRVLSNEGAITGPTQSVFYGEWEDYALNITNATVAAPCPGSAALLNANVVGGGLPYASYAWTVGSGTATLSSASAAGPSATVDADATFSITLTDACGLTASGTTSVYDVTENPLAITPVDPTVCGNPGTTFTATGGADYSWTPNDGPAALNTFTGDVVIASPVETKTYTVSGTFGAGCIGTATTTLNYTAPPAITITNEGPDADINCGYGPVYQSTLHATSAATYTYTWSNGSGFNAADTFTPGANGFLDAADDSSFVVTLTAEEVGGAGCYSVSQRAVSVFPLPTPTMTATPAVIQEGQTSALASGVTQGNFSVSPCPPSAGSIGYNRITPPAGAIALASGGVAGTPLTSGSLDDGGWSTVPLGFTYNFFGNNFTSINVGTNGVVQFGAYNAANLQDFTYSNPFPTTLEPTNIIALCAVDLYLTTSGSIRYWVDGIAPNRKFVLDFFQVPGFTTNGLQTVQLQLSETTGIFEIHLGQATSTSAKTIGVNNGDGTIGAVAPRCEGGTWNSNTATSTIQRAWKFSPPVDYTFAWSPAGEISGATNLGSATALPTASGVIGYELLITDNVSACSNALNPDSVYLTVLPAPTAPVVVGYGALSQVDSSTGTVAFCGEQGIEAYVTDAGYPATVLGQSLTYSARWYQQAVGGTYTTTALGDTITYGALTADDTLWVSVYNGYGESTRSEIVFDYESAPAIAISNSNPLNCGPSSLTYTSTLVASSSNPTPYSYSWSPAGVLDVTSGSTVLASFSNNVNITLDANDGYCYQTILTPLSRYDFPEVTPTADVDSVCPGGTTTLNSNTSSTNFTIVSDTYSPVSLTSFTSLVENGVAQVPLNTGSLDDGLWQNVPIGFTFNFLGNDYTTCAISTNGNVQFGPSYSTSFAPVFGATAPNNFAALFWTDLNFSNTGGNAIRYQTAGVAPNRVFSVFMNGTRFGDNTLRLRGQIDFIETTGVIKVNILEAAGNGSVVTVIGAENLNGTINAFAAGRNDASWSVASPEAWRFKPPVNYAFAWSPSSEISGSTTGATAIAAPTVNTTYQLIASDVNTGCDNSVSQQAFVTVNVASAPPVANFFADDTTPTTGGVIQTVTFTTTTEEIGPTTYAWTFVPNTVTYLNGTSATSRNPQVQFEEPGQYDVTMAMTSCIGTGTKFRSSYINVIPTYCQPIFGSGDGFTGCNTGYGLGNVIILNPGGVTIMNHSGTGCASPNSALGYADYSVGPVNGTTTCTMYQGTTYTINTTSLNPANNQFFAAYLDVDGDGDFNDPLEFLGFNSTASATATFSLGVPTSNVTYGLKKMRVIGAFGAGVLDVNDACLVTTYGEAHDYVVNIQPPIVLNDIPAFATNVIYSSNQVYPNYTTQTANTSAASNSPESALSTAADIWYRFVAIGQGVSIEMTSSTMDDQISLYSKDLAGNYNLISNENASSGTSDFERLNVGGLTPGTQYWVSFGAAVAGQAGAFTFSISHLAKSGCSYAVPAAGFPLCNSYKGIYRGTLPAVSYSFTFTPTGATAGTATTVVGTGSGNNLISLSNPTLALRYGGTYTARVDVTYTLFPSTGPADVILVSGSTTDANCSGISIITQPTVQVRATQRCPAALLRSTYLAGTPVVAGSVVCGATSYTYEFTQVAGGCGGAASGSLPTTFNTIANSPYLQLSVLPLLANPGAWDVKIRPNFVYGEGQYGPTQRILVNGTSASTMLNEEVAEQDVKVESFIAANLYPNPNNGEMVNLNVSGIESDNVFVRITDAMGRIVYTNRFAVEGSLNQIVTFAEPLASGIYNVEFTVDGEIMTERMIVAKQ